MTPVVNVFLLTIDDEFSLSWFGCRKCHGFNPGLFVVTRETGVFWPRLSLSYGGIRVRV